MKNLFEIEELELRNYDGVFKLIDCKVEDCVDNIDDEEWCYKVASATYHDEKRNNTLYLSEIRYEGEEIEDISIVVNAISNEAYLYLINVLNTNENVSVHWSQVYGTTSDFLDFFGLSTINDLPKIDFEAKESEEKDLFTSIYKDENNNK